MVTGDDAPLLQLLAVSRGFPGVLALDRVDFDVGRGEVHALVGENGAGKSTLIKLVSGALAPDGGEIRLEGEPVVLGSPVAARRAGIVCVHQEAELFGSLSVAENMALEHGLPTTWGGLVRWRAVWTETAAAAARLPEPLDVRLPAERLSLAQRHMTQIAAAVVRRARVLILDEPTSALSATESEWLYGELAALKAAGVGIVYISHRQEEIFRLADRITVLRDGRRVWSGPTGAIDAASLVQAMVGRAAAARNERRASPPPRDEVPRLRVRGVADAGRVRDADFDLAAGEIVGAYGLVGAGRSELARAIFGLSPRRAGRIELDGRAVDIRDPGDALAAGLAYLPEDRLREGVCRGLSVRANAVLAALRQRRWGWTRAAAERSQTAGQVSALAIKCRSVEQPIGQLSGGNQQKVVLARWLLTRPRVLLLDEPTRGIDVAAKAEIHRLVRALADDGCAVLLISSDLPEVLEHSDRVIVFREGRVAGQFDPAIARADEVARAALPDAADDSARSLPPIATDRAAQRWQRRERRQFGASGPLAGVLVLLVAALAATAPNFWTLGNLQGQLLSAAQWIVLSLAAAVVILVGGIDISIGALFALAGVTAGLVLKSGGPPGATIPLAVATAVSVGAVGGLVNAALSLVGRIHPIVVTLGALSVYRGLLVALTGGQQLTDLPPQFGALANERWLGLHGATIVAVIVALALHVWLARQRVGRHWYAVGANPIAAALAGISPGRAWLGAFALGGALAALAGLVELAQTGSIQAVSGAGYELRAIAAAVIGGVAITGGRGGVPGVLLGVALLTLVDSGVNAWLLSPHYKQLVYGGLILAAVLLDLLGWRRSR